MKLLVLIRHAKSSWADTSLSDFDRPLNERGKTDAPEMAQRLVNRQLKLDCFLTSTANRAKQTCNYFAAAFKKTEGSIIFKQELYLAPPQQFYKCITDMNNAFESVAVFAHNPGITEFANSLTNTRIDDMPTCSIFAIKMKEKSWKNFAKAEKEFFFFDFPKSSTGF